MIPAQFKTWTVALACSALVLILAPHSIAQTSSKGSMQQEVTKQQALMSDGSQKVLGASRKCQEAMRILEPKRDHTKAGQMTTEANKRMADGEKQLIEVQKLDALLLEEIGGFGEPSQKMTHGTKLMRNGMPLMKDEEALSSAQKITREGQGMLERGQKIVMTPRL